MMASDDIFQVNWASLPEFGMSAFIGRTESGKSTGMVECAYQQRHRYDMVMVFCDSADDVVKYSRIFPGAFVFEGWNESALEAAYDVQNENLVKGKPTSLLVMIDDCGFDAKVLRSKVFMRLACNGRHRRIRTLIALQDPKQLLPSIRGQIKHVFVAAEKSRPMRQRIFEVFNPMFSTFAEFDHVMQLCTQDHRMMVMNMHQSSGPDLNQNVFWCKPPFPWRQFTIPSAKRRRRAIWRFSHEWQTMARPSGGGGAVLRRATSGSGGHGVTTLQAIQTARALLKSRQTRR